MKRPQAHPQPAHAVADGAPRLAPVVRPTGQSPAPTGAAARPTWGLSAAREELLALPAPRHLHEFLIGAQHLHLGYFETPADTLAQAQERLLARHLRLFTRQSLVADVGCGLGGSVNQLAAQGHRVFGLDPCTRSIAYARKRASSPRAQFLACGLADFAARARGARFDALLLTEVLPHFRDLGQVFAHCRSVLRPGGILLVHDIVRAPGSPASAPAFHARGALANAAGAAGFDLIELREIGNRTSPSLSRLLRLLAERRAELLATFGEARPDLARELDECEAELRAREQAFARQELFYESSLLRCSARLGTDSVVLRTRPRDGALEA